jgi:hypothetical protein
VKHSVFLLALLIAAPTPLSQMREVFPNATLSLSGLTSHEQKEVVSACKALRKAAPAVCEACQAFKTTKGTTSWSQGRGTGLWWVTLGRDRSEKTWVIWHEAGHGAEYVARARGSAAVDAFMDQWSPNWRQSAGKATRAQERWADAFANKIRADQKHDKPGPYAEAQRALLGRLGVTGPLPAEPSEAPESNDEALFP